MSSSSSPVFLWTPVAFGAAAAWTLGVDDLGGAWPFWALAGVFGVLAAVAGLYGSTRLARTLVLAGCLAAGVGRAEQAVDGARAEPLQRSFEARRISGRVVHAEPKGGRVRVVLEGVDLPDRKDARVRITTVGAPETLLGRYVEGRATVGPFPGPVAPGGYDFRRGAFFERFDGAGFSYGALRPVEGRAPDARSPGERVLRWRLDLAARAEAAHGEGGALAAALTTGLRGGVSEEDADALRAAGLAHLLAISGLHMGLVVGAAFFAARFAAAGVPALALRLSTKKLAALTAFTAASGYLLLSGAAVSTQRAYVMAVMGLVAVLADRPILSLRLVAAAAWAVLLLDPSAALSAGFQMSFAAALALVALFAHTPFGRRREGRGVFGRVAHWVMILVVVDLTAGAATGIAAMHHFGRVAIYGLPANVIAGPFMAFWVLPMGLFGALMAPIGLDGPFFHLMGAGSEAILAVARTVTSWENAVRAAPVGSALSYAFAYGALLWLCLWTGAMRWFAMPAFGFAAILWLSAKPPDLLVTEKGGAAWGVDGVLVMETADAFEAGLIARRYGRLDPAPALARWPGGAACDGQGCTFRVGRALIALSNSVAGAEIDCRRARVVVLAKRFAPRGLKERCAAILIDRGDLRRCGAVAIRSDDRDGVSITRARTLDRPWSRAP